jgi:hypothetical protein
VLSCMRVQMEPGEVLIQRPACIDILLRGFHQTLELFGGLPVHGREAAFLSQQGLQVG